MARQHVVRVDKSAYDAIVRHLEASYPSEGAGFLLGTQQDGLTRVEVALPIENRREPASQSRRYLLEARDWVRAEEEAGARSLEVVGIFHSHPDHPPRPSQFDLDMALPNLAYFITSVRAGVAGQTRSWRLEPGRAGFIPDRLETP